MIDNEIIEVKNNFDFIFVYKTNSNPLEIKWPDTEEYIEASIDLSAQADIHVSFSEGGTNFGNSLKLKSGELANFKCSMINKVMSIELISRF